MTPELWTVSRWSGWPHYVVQVFLRCGALLRLSRVRILACSLDGARGLMPTGLVEAMVPAGYRGIVGAWETRDASRVRHETEAVN